MNMESDIWTVPVEPLPEQERLRRYNLTKDIVIELIQNNLARCKITEAYLYGSILTNNGKTDSDVDIALFTTLNLDYFSNQAMKIEGKFYSAFYHILSQRKIKYFEFQPVVIASNWLTDSKIFPLVGSLVGDMVTGERIF